MKRRGFFSALLAPLIARCAPKRMPVRHIVLPAVRIRAIDPWGFPPRFDAVVGTWHAFKAWAKSEAAATGGVYREAPGEVRRPDGSIARWVGNATHAQGIEWHSISFCGPWTPELAKVAEAVRVRMRRGQLRTWSAPALTVSTGDDVLVNGDRFMAGVAADDLP